MTPKGFLGKRRMVRGHAIASVKSHALMLAAALAGVILLLPADASAWGERTHRKIAELALEQLPSSYRGKIIRYKSDILDAAGQENGKKPTQNGVTAGRDPKADIQLLMLLPHDGNELSHYYAYRLGELSRAVADSTLPLSCSSDPSDKALQGKLENDIDGDIDSLKVHSVTTMCLSYPDTYIDRKSSEARKSENFVRSKYLGGAGYRACKDDVVVPSFRRAVEAVTNVWMTILSKDARPMSIPTRDRLDYYMDQIRYSSAKGYLEDVHGALHALEKEERRIPLTPTLVGQEFFNLSCSAQTKRIYDLAGRVDPQSALISDRKRMCDDHVAREPEQKEEESVAKRKVPRSLYGKEGKSPDIFIYEHKSGLLLLTSEPKDVGDDYVLINYEPIRKIKRDKVVRKVEGQPQTEEFDLEEIIRIYSREYAVSPALVKAVMQAESDFNPYVVSRCGARGLMQLMPSTALDMQIDDTDDPIQNIGGGVQYLSKMLELFNGDIKLSLAAYNAGPGAVLRYGGIPPYRETRDYVPKVLSYYEKYKYDTKPVKLTVALNKKPALDYLPEAETYEEEIETVTEVISFPMPPKPSAPASGVIISLKNGNTMRGNAYEQATGGIWLKSDSGKIFIKQEHIAKLP
jgi:hypothetical protein